MRGLLLTSKGKKGRGGSGREGPKVREGRRTGERENMREATERISAAKSR